MAGLLANGISSGRKLGTTSSLLNGRVVYYHEVDWNYDSAARKKIRERIIRAEVINELILEGIRKIRVKCAENEESSVNGEVFIIALTECVLGSNNKIIADKADSPIRFRRTGRWGEVQVQRPTERKF